MQIRFKFTLFIALNLFISSAWSQSQCENPTVKIAGQEQVMFNYLKNRCNVKDTPDISPFAFIDKNNHVQMLIGINPAIYRSVGPTLDHLTRDCTAPVFTSNPNHDAPPETFYNKVWMATPWTTDGQTVYVLIHNEFHGWEMGHRYCPNLGKKHKSGDCWYPNIMMVKSTDGGKTYHLIERPDHPGYAQLVIGTPFRYDPKLNKPQGMATQSNIISRNTQQGTFYFMFAQAFPNHGIRNGGCIFRSKNIDDPTSWRGWDGNDFTVNMSKNAYFDAVHPRQNLCKPLFNNFSIVSWSYNTVLKKYLAIGMSTQALVYVVSDDMIHWSQPTVLKTTPSLQEYSMSKPGSGVSRMTYPSVIDPTSTGRNFEYSGEHPYLYYTRFYPKTSKRDWQHRDMFRVPLEVSCS